jgi:hypothetical protein
LFEPERAALSIEQHRGILGAVIKKDGEGARGAMNKHIQSSSADLRRRLSISGPPLTPPDLAAAFEAPSSATRRRQAPRSQLR